MRTEQVEESKPKQSETEIIRDLNPQIKALAARFNMGGNDREDIEQIGRIALLKASRRWDADRAKLWTFARPSVFGAMLRHASEALAVAYEEVSIVNENGDVFETIGVPSNQETRLEIADLLNALNETERTVIRLSLEGKGLEEVGAETNRSKSEVWRIYRRAVCKMQETFAEGT